MYQLRSYGHWNVSHSKMVLRFLIALETGFSIIDYVLLPAKWSQCLVNAQTGN